MMSIPVTVNGMKYKSILQACKALGKTTSSVYLRLSRNYTLDDAFNLPYTNRMISRDHLGKTYPTFKAMCKAWDRLPVTVRYRLKKGLSIKKALTDPVPVPVQNKKNYQGTLSKDHLGKMYQSTVAMCKAWGINNWTFTTRLNKGWSIEKALTTPPLTRNGHSKNAHS